MTELWWLAIIMSSLVREDDGTWRAPIDDVDGSPCPWPFEPAMLHGMPLGQFHCSYCGSMVLAGVPHIDYTFTDEDFAELERVNGDWDAAGGPPADDPFD